MERFKIFNAEIFFRGILRAADASCFKTASSSCCPGGQTISVYFVMTDAGFLSLMMQSYETPSKSPPKGETLISNFYLSSFSPGSCIIIKISLFFLLSFRRYIVLGWIDAANKWGLTGLTEFGVNICIYI